MNNKTKKMLYATITFVAIASCLTTVYCLTSWTKTFEWTLTPKSFVVYTDAEHTIEWETDGDNIVFGAKAVGDKITTTFYIKNTGGTSITITPTISVTGATYTMTPTSDTLAVGGEATFVLELTITGAGSCTVTFEGA